MFNLHHSASVDGDFSFTEPKLLPRCSFSCPCECTSCPQSLTIDVVSLMDEPKAVWCLRTRQVFLAGNSVWKSSSDDFTFPDVRKGSGKCWNLLLFLDGKKLCQLWLEELLWWSCSGWLLSKGNFWVFKLIILENSHIILMGKIRKLHTMRPYGTYFNMGKNDFYRDCTV